MEMITFQLQHDVAAEILAGLPSAPQMSPLGILRYELQAACAEVEHREEVLDAAWRGDV